MADKRVMQDAETFTIDMAEAIARLASSMVTVAREQDLLRQMFDKAIKQIRDEREQLLKVQQLLEERNQLAEVVTALDARVQLLTKSHDRHQAVLEGAGLMPPRPKGGSLAN